MLKLEIKNPHGLRITESDTEGIFIHFQGADRERAYGIGLDDFLDKFDIGRDIVKDWVNTCIATSKLAKDDKFVHESDCGLHNQPAQPIENCNCDVAYQLLDEMQLRLTAGLNTSYSDEYLIQEAINCLSGDARRGKEAIADLPNLPKQKWHLVEKPDKDMPWCVVLDDPIKGEEVAAFRIAEDAKEFIGTKSS